MKPRLILACSGPLPENPQPQNLVDEYESERKGRAYAKQREKRGLAVPGVTSHIGRSYESALYALSQELKKSAPPEGFTVRPMQFQELPPAFRGQQLPPQGDAGVEGFVRTLQIRQGIGLLPFSVDSYSITVGEGDFRAVWKFILVFIHQS